MDLETVDPAALGRSLTGIGANLLVRDVGAMAGFARDVLELGVHRLSDDFCLLSHGDTLIQVHRDGTFGTHPVLGLVPEGARGGGVQLYLFGIDPDAAARRAEAAGAVVIEPPAEKPHGLRECTILSPEGYAFSPAVAHGA